MTSTKQVVAWARQEKIARVPKLRSLLFFFGQMASIVGYFPVAMVSIFLPPKRGISLISSWARFNLWWLGVSCNLRYRLVGNKPISPAVIMAKHQSAWETIAFQALFPPQVYILKRELLRLPLFGWGLAAAHPIAIDRSAGVKALDQVMEEGKQRLSIDLSVVVFPEGTRVNPGQKRRYRAGGAQLAIAAGVPVIPVAHNAGVFWPRGQFVKLPGVVTVEIGDPISTENRESRELTAEIEEWIEQRCLQMTDSPNGKSVQVLPRE